MDKDEPRSDRCRGARRVRARAFLRVAAALLAPAAAGAADRSAETASPGFGDFAARGEIDAEATRARARAAIPTAPLRAAIRDLAETFGSRYPRAADYLARLDRIEASLATVPPADLSVVRADLDALRREALLANPLVSGRPILFVVRKQYRQDHHNTETLFQPGEINARSYDPPGRLKILDLAKGGRVTTLVDPGPQGLVRDPDVHYDGGRIVFAMRRGPEDSYHIYEVNADGSGLKALTSAPGVSDIDPLYLPDDHIVFTSTRDPKFCMCNRHIMGNLFRMEPDGANIHQIGMSTLFEGHATMTPEGLILYDRWEYVDRNFGDAQGLWTCRPDGTSHALYWGNNTNSPGAVIDARIVPGTSLCLCLFGSCHDRPWGALAMIDRRRGVDGREPVIRTWPAGAIDQVGRGDWDAFRTYWPRYEDPYPLDAKRFLVSRSVGEGPTDRMGLYLVDTDGNEVLIHAEEPGCYDPMPLGPRPRPPVLPTARDFRDGPGIFYVQNVYRGTHMAGVAPGTVKFLRVVESPAKRSWTKPAWNGQGQQAPGMNWHDFNNKRVLGTVPVESDGSACVAVPSGRFVYFQLLDAEGKMIQSMRSGTIIQSGERQGCVGCHEDRGAEGPPPGRAPLALAKPPRSLDGWHGPPRLFNYLAEVQPVFDRHCVSCHDFGKAAGKTLNLAGDKTCFFNVSYTELWRKRVITCVGAGPAEIQPARSWGAHASRLTRYLQDHEGVSLTPEEKDRVITWMDLNAPYYPVYESAYPDHLAGRCPLDSRQLARLEQLTGVPIGRMADHKRNRGPQVCFDRPELSPCLQQLDPASGAYGEALAIIREGRTMLARRPRADMPGFVPAEDGRRRLAFHAERREAEAGSLEAIRGGGKVYDAGIGPSARWESRPPVNGPEPHQERNHGR